MVAGARNRLQASSVVQFCFERLRPKRLFAAVPCPGESAQAGEPVAEEEDDAGFRDGGQFNVGHDQYRLARAIQVRKQASDILKAAGLECREVEGSPSECI